jgi:hypothetical protein
VLGSLPGWGGNGTFDNVELDKAFIGREPGTPKTRAYAHKAKVLNRVDRESNEVRLIAIDDLISARRSPPSWKKTSPKKYRLCLTKRDNMVRLVRN